MKVFLNLVIILLVLSCSRDWETNPLESDQDLKHQPAIEHISLDARNNIVLYLNYAYSLESSITVERKTVGGFDPIASVRLTQLTVIDTVFDKELDHNFTYRVLVKKNNYSTGYSPEKAFAYESKLVNAPEYLHSSTLELQGIKLEWRDRSNKEDGYKIEKNDGKGWAELASLPANSQNYMDAINGIPSLPLELSYRVKAFNSSLSSQWAEIGTTYTGIGVPTNLRITDTTSWHFTIEWQDKSNIETAYIVERNKNGGAFMEVAQIGTNTTEFIDIISEKGIIAYRVRAKMDVLYSWYSNEVSHKAQIILPLEGLVAFYPFNGNANDESGNLNHGKNYGAILTKDRFGIANSAYSFNGSSYIKASATNLPISERTTALWFNANTFAPTPVLLGYGGNSSSSPPGTSWFMYLGSAGIGRASHWGTDEMYVSFKLETASWYHFAVTTDITGTRIFINGKQKAAWGTFINNTFVNGKDLSIGVDVDADGKAPFTNQDVGYFNGIIDDVRIYNRALSDIEIKALYHEGGWGN